MILGGPRLRFLVLLQHVCLVMIVVGPVGFPPLSYEGLFIQKDRAKLVSRLILDLIELFELQISRLVFLLRGNSEPRGTVWREAKC